MTRCRTKGLAWSVLLVLLVWLGPSTADSAGATPAAVRDDVRLVSLRAQQTPGSGPNLPVRFDAAVQYGLASTPRAFVALFVFEDNSDTAKTHRADAVWITAGTGTADLTTTYQPTPGLHTIMVVAALLRDDQTLLAWSASPSFSLSDWPGRALFNQALQARRAGNYEQAIDALTSAIQLAPQTGAYYCWRADSRIHLGAYADAIADYTRALDLMPGNHACRVGRAVALLWLRQWQRAATDLSQIIEDGDPTDPWVAPALRARGLAYAGLGQYEAALADYRAYLALHPSVSDRIRVQGWMGDLTDASAE